MARELVNLSTANEKLLEKTKHYPILSEQHKVYRLLNMRKVFVSIDYLIGIGKTL